MDIRISEELNLIVSYAREEAMRTGSYSIGVDHLFLGILRHADNDACRTLVGLGVNVEEFKGHIDYSIFRSESISYSEMDHLVFSRQTQNALNLTLLEAARLRDTFATPAHLLLAIVRLTGTASQKFLSSKGITYADVLRYTREHDYLPATSEDGTPTGSRPEEKSPAKAAADSILSSRPKPAAEEEAPEAEPSNDGEASLVIEEFGYELTAAAREGQLDPVVGRDREIERVVEILGRRKKNNPMLIGEPGVGKSAIVEGIALRIAAGDVPPVLKGRRLFTLEIGSLVAGTRYRGDFENRIKNVIEELRNHPEIILFIDEFHTIVGAGGAQGSLDAANMLKPALARGEIQCIGATTRDEFTKIVEKDGALDRRFQKIVVEAPGIAETLKILHELRPQYEKYHNVKYTDEALEACVRHTDRYLPDLQLPDKAIDAMDEAGSMIRLGLGPAGAGREGKVDADAVAEVVSKMSGVPAGKVARGEKARLMEMKKHLCGKVIGQDEAIDTVCRAIMRSRSGIKDPGKPIGTFLFFGPTGVGKTRLAKCLAEYLFDSEDNLIRIDMSEYTEKIAATRLIGAPPGYVGYEEGGQLSEAVRRKPYSVVLLDEIEKAHPDIFNLLLQVLDEGRLTDGNGRHINFRNTIVIMTSNVGSRELDDYGRGIGFSAAGRDVDGNRKGVLDKSIRKTFPPEFINRIDEQVFFNSLSREDLGRIVDIEVADLRRRVADAGYDLHITEGARKFIASAGFDPTYGARPLKRAVTRYVEDPVSEFIIGERFTRHGAGDASKTLKVSLSADKLGTKVSLA